MIIYSVMITSTFEAEEMMLFTSLRKAVNFAIYKFNENIQHMFDEDQEEIEEYLNDYPEHYPKYSEIKKQINKEEDYPDNSWGTCIQTYDSYYLTITKHDSNNPLWYNQQHGGF